MFKIQPFAKVSHPFMLVKKKKSLLVNHFKTDISKCRKNLLRALIEQLLSFLKF